MMVRENLYNLLNLLNIKFFLLFAAVLSCTSGCIMQANEQFSNSWCIHDFVVEGCFSDNSSEI